MTGKIKRHVKDIIKNFKNDCHFSIRLGFSGVLGRSIGRIIPIISEKCGQYRIEYVLRYLECMLKELIEEHEENNEVGEFVEDAPIWVCWWTGIETAPKLVKQCVRSIQNAAGTHPVHIITQSNYKEFLNIPSYILEKVQNGNMCIANFSDYLRVSLLEKYGGLWLDATIYVPRTIPESFFERNIYTCKSPGAKGYLANGRWTSYCLGGWKNHLFFKVARECFECYWEKEEVAIDYLLVDYVFSIIYDNNAYVRDCFDTIPINNMQRNNLAGAMVRGECADKFSEIITEKTLFYKLSWREKYPLVTVNGEESIYKYFLNL